MNAVDIIDRYYQENDPLRTILLTHSEQVAQKALTIADRHPQWHIDRQFVASASLLHDIGIVCCHAPAIHCYGTEPYITHGLCGARLLLADGWQEHFPLPLLRRWARVCLRHTGAGLTQQEIAANHFPLPAQDFLPETIEEKLICYADKFFSKTRLDSEKSLDKVLADMESYSPAALQRFVTLHNLFCSAATFHA